MKGLLLTVCIILFFRFRNFQNKNQREIFIFIFFTSRPDRLKDLSILKANIILLRANLAWLNYWDFFNMTNKNVGKWEIYS